MKQSTIDRLRALFDRHPLLVAGGVAQDEIDLAEQAIGVKFAPDYRAFVAEYGGAMVGSLPVVGLRRAEVMGNELCSVVDVTRSFRDDGWKPTHEWSVISVDGSGNPIGTSADGQVWISDHDTGEVKVIASCFEDFLLSLLDGAVV